MINTVQLQYASRSASFSERTRQRIAISGQTVNGFPLWTETEHVVCRQLHPDVEAIRRRLPHRTLVAIQERCRKLGLCRRRNPWTGTEVAKLRRLYPTATKEELVAAFPRHSYVAIKLAANKRSIYKVKKPYVPTGNPLLDEVRSRCYELRITMPDLDEISGTKKFFTKSRWWKHRSPFSPTMRAVAALAGNLRVEWDDD